MLPNIIVGNPLTKSEITKFPVDELDLFITVSKRLSPLTVTLLIPIELKSVLERSSCTKK